MMNTFDDTKLIERMRNGDTDAFNLLFERYKRPLYAYVLKMARNRSEADDLFQETFLRILKNIKRYNHKGRFLSWTFTIATNLMRDTHRKKRHSAGVSLQDPVGNGTTLTVEDTIPTKYATPEQQHAHNELAHAIETAVSTLPHEQQQVFVLRETSGMTFKEIAEMLACPLNTVLGRMHYAITSLRKQLKPYQEERHAL